MVRVRQRAEVTYAVLPGGAPQRGVTFDLSAGGIGLVTDRVLELWTQVQVSLALPDRGAPVPFIGQVMWSQARETTDRARRARTVWTALRISEIAPRDQDALADFVGKMVTGTHFQ